MGTGSSDKLTDPPLATAPRGTVGGRPPADYGRREPVQFEAEGAPVVTPTVAAVLARIVRTLRDRQKM